MQLSKLEFLRSLAGSVGVVGAVSVLLGGATLLVGITGIGAIKLGEVLKPKQVFIEGLVYTGSLYVGGGLFVVGAVGAVCDKLNDYIWDEEINERLAALGEKEKREVPTSCKSCKYFYGSAYLPCAVNPQLDENCPPSSGFISYSSLFVDKRIFRSDFGGGKIRGTSITHTRAHARVQKKGTPPPRQHETTAQLLHPWLLCNGGSASAHGTTIAQLRGGEASWVLLHQYSGLVKYHSSLCSTPVSSMSCSTTSSKLFASTQYVACGLLQEKGK